MGRATARAPMEKPAALNAPLFRQLIEQLDSNRRLVVLDLGAASTPMLSLLGQYRCLAEIADLASDGSIDLLNNEMPADARCQVAESVLPRHTADTEVDYVFCWDLLNYLKPEAITALARAILARRSAASRRIRRIPGRHARGSTNAGKQKRSRYARPRGRVSNCKQAMPSTRKAVAIRLR